MGAFEVGCAIIHKEGMLLIAQRHLQDSFGGFWEFPGGKREEHETLEQCLVREVYEELGIHIRPYRPLLRKDIENSGKKLSLFFYFCEWQNGDPQALDCKDFKWVTRDDIQQYSFLPGDTEVLKDLCLRWDEYFKTTKTGR
jgi:mutator protein MutT